MDITDTKLAKLTGFDNMESTLEAVTCKHLLTNLASVCHTLLQPLLRNRKWALWTHLWIQV